MFTQVCRTNAQTGTKIICVCVCVCVCARACVRVNKITSHLKKSFLKYLNKNST